MPNQLAKYKRRKSLAEHEAVLAAIESIARMEKTTAMEMMRQALREIVKNQSQKPSRRREILSSVMAFAPKAPRGFATAAQLSRFKRQQREFDKILMELNLELPESIEARNSIVSPNSMIRVLEMET